ncbi:MAG: ABC transporter permease [Thermovirgaceae bacterium]
MRPARRWSVLALVAVTLLGILGPLAFSGTPESQVASPFAKPRWSPGDEAPPLSAVLSEENTSAEITWKWDPPPNLTISGFVRYSEPVTGARLLWRTPAGETFVLAASGESNTLKVDIDGRDVTFKQALGLSPFKDVTSALFPEKGRYLLAIDPDSGIGEARLTFETPGEKWGLLGTDQRGRDVFRLFLLGIRISLLVGVTATLLAAVIGMGIGLSAGYAGGIFDALVMRVVDILLSIPTLPILMVLAGLWGRGLWQLVFILGAFSWMGTARTVRALTLSLRETCYVENLRSIGAPASYILRRHLLPEALPVLLANIALGVPAAILAEAGLSFLGLSDPRIISWGRMLQEAHAFGAFSTGAWWLILPPGLGIAAICLIFLDIGRTLEEMADPRLRKEAAR